MSGRKHPTEWPEKDRWWEQHKIVVWSLEPNGEPTDEYGCGDTPEEVIDFFRARSWIDEERDDSKKWMEGVHSRLPIGYEETFVYFDAESFLFGMVKIGAMKIEKWEWEPSDLSSDERD